MEVDGLRSICEQVSTIYVNLYHLLFAEGKVRLEREYSWFVFEVRMALIPLCWSLIVKLVIAEIQKV